MIRTALGALAIVVGVAAPALMPAPVGGPTAPLRAAPAAAPPVRLVPGGMMRTVLVWSLPVFPNPPSNLATGGHSTLDRIAYAVEGAESSHGRNPLMWRADLRGPQGPMQVAALAAVDVGGGDRFDVDQNRALGRAYLARMYQRYGNWGDTLLAYNWGPGNLDSWIRAGRPPGWLSANTFSYVTRVLSESNAPASHGILPPQRASQPPPPGVRAATIADRGLRRRVVDNNRLIERLRAFLDGDPHSLAAGDMATRRRLRQVGAKLVFAVIREVSRRPGYDNFKPARGRTTTPDIAASRLIAALLVAKLEDENASLALVDSHRRQRSLRAQSRETAPARRVRSEPLANRATSSPAG